MNNKVIGRFLNYCYVTIRNMECGLTEYCSLLDKIRKIYLNNFVMPIEFAIAGQLLYYCFYCESAYSKDT